MATISQVSVHSVQKSCDIVVNSVRSSFLNFSLQETPFSLYFTIRKSFVKSQPLPFLHPPHKTNIKEDEVVVEEIETLKTKLKALEDNNTALLHNYEEAVNDCEESYNTIKDLEAKIKDYEVKATDKVASESHKNNKIIEQLKEDKVHLENELDTAEKQWKTLNKALKVNDKELHDTKKENAKLKENLEEVNTELKNIIMKVNKDKKNDEKKLKKLEKKEFMDNLKASQSLSFECNKCEVKKESLAELKSHERLYHMKYSSTQTLETPLEDKTVQSDFSDYSSDKQVQTEKDIYEPEILKEYEFKKYPCFYCSINIASEYHLSEHRTKCRGSAKMGLVSLPMSFGFSPGFLPPRHHSSFSFRGFK